MADSVVLCEREREVFCVLSYQPRFPAVVGAFLARSLPSGTRRLCHFPFVVKSAAHWSFQKEKKKPAHSTPTPTFVTSDMLGGGFSSCLPFVRKSDMTSRNIFDYVYLETNKQNKLVLDTTTRVSL